jgi:hypothetical protein
MELQDTQIIRVLLALGALFLVPLALPTLDATRLRRAPSLVPWVLGGLFAAAMVIGSGPRAVALALPLTVGAASFLALELVQLVTHPSFDRLAITLASGWLAAASAVACFALSEPGVPLASEYLRWPTPAHFLYAGFGLTTLARCVHRERRTLGSCAALLAVLVGMPTLAIEIAFVPMSQWTGAVLMAGAALAVGTQQLVVAWYARQPVRWMLTLSSVALATAMALAVAYGLATRFNVSGPSLTTMVRVHGVLNSVGFVGFGVIGWRLLRFRPPDTVRARATGPRT